MPGATRKSGDAAPAAVEPEAAPAEAGATAPVAEETPAEAPAEDAFRPSVNVVFTGQAQSSVAGVGLVDPGVEYPVPAAIADELCRGGLFTLAASA